MSDIDNPYANPVSVAPPLSPAEEKQWAVLAHVLGIFFGIITAAVFFFLYKDRGPFVRSHVVAEWNFRLTIAIVAGVIGLFAVSGWVIAFATALSGPEASSGMALSGIVMFLIGWVALVIVQLTAAVLGVVASVKASNGLRYVFPLSISFVKR